MVISKVGVQLELCRHGRRRTTPTQSRCFARHRTRPAVLSCRPSQPKAFRSICASPRSPTSTRISPAQRSPRAGREALGETAREWCSPSLSILASTDPSTARFTHNPHIALPSTSDFAHPLQVPLSTFPHPLPAYLPRSLLVPPSRPPPSLPHTSAAGLFSLSLRGARRTLRARPSSAYLVKAIESHLAAWLQGGIYLNPDQADSLFHFPGDPVGGRDDIREVSREAGRLVWAVKSGFALANPGYHDGGFERYVVHCVARWYGVVSFSTSFPHRPLSPTDTTCQARKQTVIVLRTSSAPISRAPILVSMQHLERSIHLQRPTPPISMSPMPASPTSTRQTPPTTTLPTPPTSTLSLTIYPLAPTHSPISKNLVLLPLPGLPLAGPTFPSTRTTTQTTVDLRLPWNLSPSPLISPLTVWRRRRRTRRSHRLVSRMTLSQLEPDPLLMELDWTNKARTQHHPAPAPTEIACVHFILAQRLPLLQLVGLRTVYLLPASRLQGGRGKPRTTRKASPGL